MLMDNDCWIAKSNLYPPLYLTCKLSGRGFLIFRGSPSSDARKTKKRKKMKKRKDCWIAGTDQISSIFGTDDADGRQEEMPRATRRVLNLNAPHPVHIEDDGRADAGAIRR